MPKTHKGQFTIGWLVYMTMFAATIVACLQTGFPYGFIYPIGFVIVVFAYVAWETSRTEAAILVEQADESLDDEAVVFESDPENNND